MKNKEKTHQNDMQTYGHTTLNAEKRQLTENKTNRIIDVNNCWSAVEKCANINSKINLLL